MPEKAKCPDCGSSNTGWDCDGTFCKNCGSGA